MSIELKEGTIITLDAHTTDLLELYTIEHNAWLRESLKGRECPFELEEADMSEVGRELLTSFLHKWARQRKRGK